MKKPVRTLLAGQPLDAIKFADKPLSQNPEIVSLSVIIGARHNELQGWPYYAEQSEESRL